MRKENVVNKIKGFPGKFLSGVSRLYSRLVNKETSLFYQQRISGRSRIKCRITPSFYNVGFTLIELLVVVLIIGILAAVALPQYKKAVEKARMTEAIMAVESIAKANDMYKMANGSYTRDINDLDIEYNAEDYDYGGISAKQTQYFILAASNAVGDQSQKAVIQRIPEGTKYALIIYFNGTKECVPYSGISAYEQQLCQAWAAGQ